MSLSKKLAAEFLGTFWLVLGGCGAAVLATNPAAFDVLSIGFVGVSFAFGLTVLTMAYAVGHISGGHFNPAVSVGLMMGGKFESKNLIPYWVAQVVGAIAASGVLYTIASGIPDFAIGGFATNGFGEAPAGHAGSGYSPAGFSMMAALVCEIVMTFFFLLIILGATDRLAPAGFAPIAIGLGLTLIHLISIPVTNTSVNPARSIGPALFTQGAALTQVWLFIAGPMIGAALAGIVHRSLLATPDEA